MIGEVIYKPRRKTSNKLTAISLNLLIIVFILFALSIPRIVYAAVFHIHSGNVNALIDTINAANSNGEDDAIKLKAGTYTLTSADNYTDGDNGLPSITSKITITGAGADTTIIERDANADSFRIFLVASTGILTLDGLSVIGGVSTESIGLELENSGAGILNNGGVVNITSGTIADNTAVSGDGGGIFNFGGTINITDSTVVGNRSVGFAFGGGGMFNDNGTVNIDRSTISGNRSDGSNGGGLQNFGTMNITDSIIAENVVTDGRGGGIFNEGHMIITNSTLSSNIGVVSGGIETRGTATIINSAITSNITSAEGSGISNFGMVDVINSTIANNFNSGFFGAGAISNFGGRVKITNCTVVNNSSSFGDSGGIFNDTEGMVELQNTILALNTSGFDSASIASDCIGEITSLANNLVGDTTDCTITLQATDLTVDPELGDFTDDGTPGNGHFPLVHDSQAIDAGNNDVCLDDPILATDQIGSPRFGICDIGSTESQSFINVKQCLSTMIEQNCSGLTGEEQADCKHQQQQFCKILFS